MNENEIGRRLASIDEDLRITEIALNDVERRVEVLEMEQWAGEHLECFDGCGLAVDHDPPCRNKPGGRILNGD